MTSPATTSPMFNPSAAAGYNAQQLQLIQTQNYLRMKWRWYYNWHTERLASKIHILILVIIIAVILFFITGGSLGK